MSEAIIKLYAATQTFETDEGRRRFSVHIAARDFAEAEQLARQLCASLDGELVESVCAGCGKVETFNDSHTAEPTTEVWADVIE